MEFLTARLFGELSLPGFYLQHQHRLMPYNTVVVFVVVIFVVAGSSSSITLLAPTGWLAPGSPQWVTPAAPIWMISLFLVPQVSGILTASQFEELSLPGFYLQHQRRSMPYNCFFCCCGVKVQYGGLETRYGHVPLHNYCRKCNIKVMSFNDL